MIKADDFQDAVNAYICASKTKWERNCERVVLPLAVKRGRGHGLAERIAEQSEASRAMQAQ